MRTMPRQAAVFGMSLSVAILLFSGCGKAPEPVEDGSIGIHLADWVPALGHNGWWGVVLAGRPVGEKVGSAEDLQAIAVAPGKYDVYWIQDYNHENDPMRLGSDVLVESGRETTLNADSGIRLDKADWVPKIGHNGWWGAVPAGMKIDDRVDWAQNEPALLLPPGKYDVYWIQDYKHENDRMRLAADVLVEPGKATALAVDSGIRLESVGPIPEIGHNGWWGAVPAGLAIDERVDWSSSGSQPLLLPPGNYDLYWREDYSADPRRIAEAIEVTPGQLSVVPAEFPST